MRKTLHIVIALVTLLCAWGVSGVLAQSGTERPFITKWQGEAGKELKIPIVGTYKMVIKVVSRKVCRQPAYLLFFIPAVPIATLGNPKALLSIR